MRPTYNPNDILLATRIFFTIQPSDVVVILHSQTKRLLLKRVKEKKKDLFFVLGDNEKESTDSRMFGWIARKDIMAKVFFV